MDITLQPNKLSGAVEMPTSKSLVHRFLICAAFAKTPTRLLCSGTGADVDATVRCLQAMGAHIAKTESGYAISPITHLPAQADLFCGESGTTLRLLLPIVGALGLDATFHLSGRLPSRPLSPLWEEMERMGCRLSRPTADTVRCQGKLRPGQYRIAGNVSSQFISGLLLALPHISGESSLSILGKIESAPYVALTRHAISLFACVPTHPLQVEGDWSSGAFFLAANALGSQIKIRGLSADSLQGDAAVVPLLQDLQKNTTVSAADIPDLIPVLSIVAAAGKGAVFTHIQRLRLKESDRVAAIVSMVNALGGHARATEDTLTVFGTGLTGGTVDSFRDHRIAMSAAIAATVCSRPVTILGAECVEKSYPNFWQAYKMLGGNYV